MVELVASRRAGRALLTILVVLIVPMLVLGASYVNLAYKEVQTLDRELLGSKIVQLVYPLILSDTKASSKELDEKISNLEKQLGFAAGNGYAAHIKAATRSENQVVHHNVLDKEDVAETAEGDVLNANAENHDHDENLSGYLADVSDRSGLILDSNAASYYLIRAMISDLPDLLLSFREMAQHSSSPGREVTDLSAFALFHNQLGRASLAVKNFEQGVNAARSYSETPKVFLELNQLVEEAEASVVNIIEKSGSGTQVPESLPLEAFGVAEVEGRKIIETAQKFQRKAFMVLDQKLSQRRSNAFTRLLIMTALGLVAAAVGLYLALKLIRNTLVKLDEVEEARQHAVRISDEVATLNSELAEKMAMLRNAQDEIVKKGKMEQMGQLTATVAHELRNPLGAVRTSAFLIQRKVAGKNLGIETQLERINQGVMRCDNTITQLLDYSRTRKVTPTETNLDDWLADIVTEEGQKLPASINVECYLGLNEKLVPIDKDRLRRAITNLITNAVEAMMGQSADETKQNKLLINTNIVGEYAVIKVNDNGPGISTENLTKIREPLFTTKNFGTGLGIPAIEQIVEQHDGHLEISSQEGQGATFEVFIPLRNAQNHETKVA